MDPIYDEAHQIATESLPSGSDGELFLTFGRMVRARLRLWVSLEAIARSTGLSPLDCALALAFAEGPDWLKLRAMVEDWSWLEIKQQVCAQLGLVAPADCPPAVVEDTANKSDKAEAPKLPVAEVRRRTWHMLPGVLPFGLAFVPHAHPLPWDSLCRISAMAALLTLGVFFTYRWIARPGDRCSVLNIVSYPLSVVLMLLAFPHHPEFAAVVCTVLAFGDGTATLMGLLFGQRPLPWNRSKTWVGSMSFLLAAAPIAAAAYWIESRPHVTAGTAMFCGFVAALVADLAESLPIQLSDNFRVGVAASFGVLLAHSVTVASI
jgi:dolichol kinase